MGLLYLFISIFGESAGKTIDKLSFRRNRITARQYMFLVFLAMTLSLLVFVIFTKQHLPRYSFDALALTAAIAAFSFGGNVFDCLSVKADDISLREPLVDLEPIAAGVVGYFIFPGEQKPIYLVAFIASIFIVRWGIHRRKLRKRQNKGMFYLWIAVILYAVLPSLYKEALHYMSPTYIALFRIAAILVLTTIFFPMKSTKGISAKKIQYSFGSGVIYAIAAVANIYAISVFGVVLTMLFTMLGPALRYLSGYFILHEKVRVGEVVSSVLLTIVVVVAAIVR
ncbi:MAG: EamA family transporter [Candidatus Saccharimonadales bacterium]